MIDLGGPVRTAVFLAVGVLGFAFVVNALLERDAGSKTDVATEATRRTFGGLSALLMGLATVFAVVTSEVSNLLGLFGELVAMFSGEAANAFVIGLGAIGLSGVVEIGPVEFIIASLAALALVVVIRR